MALECMQHATCEHGNVPHTRRNCANHMHSYVYVMRVCVCMYVREYLRKLRDTQTTDGQAAIIPLQSAANSGPLTERA